MNSRDHAALEALELVVRTILPERYQDCYDDVKPVSMGSAGLKFAPDGKVAWDEIWGSFCDLAMAGGPPHKGTLLLPASHSDIMAHSSCYHEVVQEICRGVKMVSDLHAEPSTNPGWIRVECVNRVTAEWLLRAITVENIAVRQDGLELELPAAPAYRLEKEIKNVITVMAKTSHYWFGHIFAGQRNKIRELLTDMEQDKPLLRPGYGLRLLPDQTVKNQMAERLMELTGLRASSHSYADWLGFEYKSIRSAVWMVRALVASNVLSRREDAVVFVPIDPIHDSNGEIAVESITRLHNFALPVPLS